MWSAKERTIIARTKQYMEESHSVKVEVEELEDQDDVDVDFRRILKKARGCETFEWIPGGQSVTMGQVQKKMERTMETQFVSLCK